MGAGGASIPHDVVRVRVDPSVTAISADAFRYCMKLADVELCEGLVEKLPKLPKSNFFKPYVKKKKKGNGSVGFGGNC
jgi:hypothetical protein